MANMGIPKFPLFDPFSLKMSCPLFGVPTVFAKTRLQCTKVPQMSITNEFIPFYNQNPVLNFGFVSFIFFWSFFGIIFLTWTTHLRKASWKSDTTHLSNCLILGCLSRLPAVLKFITLFNVRKARFSPTWIFTQVRLKFDDFLTDWKLHAERFFLNFQVNEVLA